MRDGRSHPRVNVPPPVWTLKSFIANSSMQPPARIMGGEEDEPSAGKGEGLIDREVLGMTVRAAWVDWARAQPNPRESWVIPWDSLADEIKEVDRRVGESVEEYVLDALELATKMKQGASTRRR